MKLASGSESRWPLRGRRLYEPGAIGRCRMEEIKPHAIYTVKQASAILQISERTILRYCAQGILPAVKIGKFWRVPGSKLLAFLEGASGSERR